MAGSSDYRAGSAAAVAALFAGATVWGLVWYPYRLIEAAGMSGLLATTLTYAVALVLGSPRSVREVLAGLVAQARQGKLAGAEHSGTAAAVESLVVALLEAGVIRRRR